MATVTRGWVTYGQDNGTNVSIKCTSNTAAQNGTTVSKFPTVGGAWPYHKRDLRHVIGHSTAGKSATLTVLDESRYSALVIGVDNFQDSNGTTYTITSKIGEKANARDAR